MNLAYVYQVNFFEEIGKDFFFLKRGIYIQNMSDLFTRVFYCSALCQCLRPAGYLENFDV